MRRSVDQGDSAGARRAAEGLRDAMAALGGLQRNRSAGKLDDLGHKAQQLADRARQQQQQLKDLIAHPNGVDPAHPPPSTESLINARQGLLADDVGRLEQDLRDAERAALKGNRDAATKLRQSLSGLDESRCGDSAATQRRSDASRL